MLIVKIMCANRGNDDHPRHGHRIFADVREVDFYEAPKGPGSGPGVYLMISGQEEPVHIELDGNVYVMNEAGRTISRFEVAEFASPE